MRVVVAPDSFKGSASAIEVARALAAGWSAARPGDGIRLLPMADGGEGTLDAFEVAVPGSERMPVAVEGPDGRLVETSWLLLPARDGSSTALVELACTSGITLLDPLRPLDAHTTGFGQAIAAALDHGVSRLLLAIGGSSSTDGGTGALTVLGARFLDANGAPIAPGGGHLSAVAAADLSGLRALPPDGVDILGDVTNPLLGLGGASAVFGPQKGANGAQLELLEAGLARLAALLPADPNIPGAGAAGGAGFGLLAWGATLWPGAAAVGDALGLPDAVASADIVITGEGRFDEQSAAGKVPAYVAGLAARNGIPALLVAGSLQAPTTTFAAARALIDLAGGLEPALHQPLHWLHQAAESLATERFR